MIGLSEYCTAQLPETFNLQSSTEDNRSNRSTKTTVSKIPVHYDGFG